MSSSASSSLADPPAFAGNVNAAAVAERLRSCKRVLILTHTKPDGDAMGSALALARVLSAINIVPTVMLFPPVSQSLRGLASHNEYVIAPRDTEPAAMSPEVDCIVVVDTGSWSQLGPAAVLVRDCADKTIIIDHHVNGNPEIATTRLIDGTAPAACQLVAQIALHLLDLPSAAQLPIEIAEPLYLGIATDTGWFRHPSVMPQTLRLAADLLETGVNQNALYRRMEQNDRPQRLALAQRMLNNMQYVADGRGAIMVLTHNDFAESGAQLDETGGLIDFPLSVGNVQVAALLYEPEPGLTRISMRSKDGDTPVDVNRIAHSLGGGGHKHAAGARVARPAAGVLPTLIAAIEEALS